MIELLTLKRQAREPGYALPSHPTPLPTFPLRAGGCPGGGCRKCREAPVPGTLVPRQNILGHRRGAMLRECHVHVVHTPRPLARRHGHDGGADNQDMREWWYPPVAHIINCSGAPSTRAKESTRDSKGDPGNRNLNPLPLRLGTQVAVALGPLCRSMPLHHATFPLVLHHGNRVAGLPPTVRHGLASPRDSPCDRDSARSCIARGFAVYACVRKGIPKDPCCTATGQCVTSIVRPSVAKHPYLVRWFRHAV